MRLEAVQTLASRPDGFLGYRVGASSTGTLLTDLYIKTGSANVNVSNKTWAGMYFNSVTLI